MDEMAKIIPVVDKATKDMLKKKKNKKDQGSKEEKKQPPKSKTMKKQGSTNNLPSVPAKQATRKLSNPDDSKKKDQAALSATEGKIQEIKEVPAEKEEEKPKKPKPEMIDAWTQTERSDY